MISWGTVIVAAGSGTRFGGEIPKQYAPLAGKPVICWSLDLLAGQGPVVIVANPAHAAFYTPIVDAYKNVRVVSGGATRQESVLAGLNGFSVKPKHVMIHDSARPLLDADSVSRLKSAVEQGAKSATLAIAVPDTLTRGGREMIDRTDVHAIQTPQAFDYDLIAGAHKDAGKSYTDDTTLVMGERGIATTLVPGCPDNFKITTQNELAWAERIMLSDYGETRTGIAVDFHQFTDSDGTMRLFGCDIPSPKALTGHSDADAALHAIADAILGTVGAGDIGLMFPPSDPKWKGMDSARIVQAALRTLADKGGILRHVDIMLMAEHPRIGLHREMILQRLSQILSLPLDSIGLKATTTEGMGFIGRGEGLAVQAVATVRLRA